MHFDGRRVQAFDGRETAPAGATDTLFLTPSGEPMAFDAAVVGGRAVGVPGTLHMLEMAHRQHGKLPWAALMEPAIALAQQGFDVSPRLHQLLASDRHLHLDPVAAAYFYNANGQPWPVGHRLKNPELAHVLRAIADQGAQALMQGEVAQAIVNKVQQHRSNAGLLSLADLAGYRAVEREPLCHDYQARLRLYQICGMPPPGSGTLAIGQILGMLAHTDARALPLQQGLPSADWLHHYLEASRLAFADRAAFVADPDFTAPPGGQWLSLLDPAYLAARAGLIGPVSMGTAPAGQPPGPSGHTRYAPMVSQPEYGTSHISVIDAWGNALAMTSSIESAFGSRQMVNTSGHEQARRGGFLLNNELTDFSFSPRGADGRLVANRVQPGKRPRSSMAPTLVFDKITGQLVLSTGSPGGAFIITFTAKTLYGMLNWGLNAKAAIDLPNFGTLGGPSLLEEKRFDRAKVQAIKARGTEVLEIPLTSGLQAIEKTTEGLFGGADPRREGLVLGD